MKIENGSKVVFIGDSVTDFGRARPVGEGLGEAMGTSYVQLVDSLLKSTYPESRIRIVNMGNSGDTTRDLLARWKTDVLDLNPDWLSILIGINDVWRQFDAPLIPELHVYLDEYEKNLENLILQTKSSLKGLILMTPYIMEPNKNDPMRMQMDKYGDVVKRMAQKYNAIFIDLQAVFDRYLAFYHPMSVTWDRIHPNTVGHMLITKEILKALEYEWQ